ncbi:hypothetical protein OU995_26420 [Roseateles sp. SL47]|uniref:hypothetical protein n=1 Tax=Roseateles sp. SL47 TaxID=2995138 RepID=UPI002270FA01|nr:hypothetical protein [Roseateles sp. SL47]WAC73003.1 hypothetical protein OU995_26420 [Roseateles sp. SL47]
MFTQKQGQVFREQMDDVALEATVDIGSTALTWRREMGDRGGKAKKFVQLGVNDRTRLKSGESPDLPLLLYYGAGRLWTLHDNVESDRPTSQLDAYRLSRLSGNGAPGSRSGVIAPAQGGAGKLIRLKPPTVDG